MRLNIVFFTAILALVASVDPASAASDATVMKLPMVMNSADAHEVMGNDHRLLRTHKNADTEEKERGFADVVIEAMTKLKADKLYSEINEVETDCCSRKGRYEGAQEARWHGGSIHPES
ncbi:unnamed protein product [Phytophthora lilii]|uniref:RxLR effector protein n=1 Tax=Phytophthora lilii TaxID=2077276 RepID=A0A9W6TFV2_9STRA|nr:unnamed protein product [Phytophthora lilii]